MLYGVVQYWLADALSTALLFMQQDVCIKKIGYDTKCILMTCIHKKGCFFVIIFYYHIVSVSYSQQTI